MGQRSRRAADTKTGIRSRNISSAAQTTFVENFPPIHDNNRKMHLDGAFHECSA